MDLEMIRTRMAQIEDLEAEVKKAKELLKSELENDEPYRDAVQKAKEATAQRKQLKEMVFASNNNQSMLEDIKADTEEINTLKEILSAELFEYYGQKKTDEIQDKNGQMRKFKVTVKLLPARDSYDKRDFEGRYAEEEVKPPVIEREESKTEPKELQEENV
jgi:hypothetical protein